MFGLSKKDNYSYSGDGCYKYIEPLIKNSHGELKIISPFISDGYAKMLINASRKRKVYVITSGSTGIEDKKTLKELTENRKRYNILPLFYASLAAFVLYSFQEYLYFAAACALIAGIIFVTYTLNKKRLSNLKVKVVTNKFIHEKMYITRETAITGSANLTFSGMHRNIEHIDVIKDVSKISEMSKHFDYLWSRY
jgi:phosphatidylserine/phosphatidylglycerophosphate/cardiolipin synthase-like enzyme